MKKTFELITICGKTALFTNDRVKPELVPKEMYKYDLRGGDEEAFCTIEKKVIVNHSGTILTTEPFDFGDKDYIELDDDNSPDFSACEHICFQLEPDTVLLATYGDIGCSEKWFVVSEKHLIALLEKMDEYNERKGVDLDNFLQNYCFDETEYIYAAVDGSGHILCEFSVKPDKIDYEIDRYCIGSESVTAIYLNPNGNNDKGTFMEHTFPYDHILKMDAECGEGEDADEAFWDSLYGDAFHCATYCTDAGTPSFNGMVKSYKDAICLSDKSTSYFRKWIVGIAKERSE